MAAVLLAREKGKTALSCRVHREQETKHLGAQKNVRDLKSILALVNAVHVWKNIDRPYAR